MASDDVEDQIRCLTGDIRHALTHVRAEVGQHLIWIEIEACVYLPAIAPRGTLSGIIGLEHDSVDPQLSEMQGR